MLIKINQTPETLRFLKPWLDKFLSKHNDIQGETDILLDFLSSNGNDKKGVYLLVDDKTQKPKGYALIAFDLLFDDAIFVAQAASDNGYARRLFDGLKEIARKSGRNKIQWISERPGVNADALQRILKDVTIRNKGILIEGELKDGIV